MTAHDAAHSIGPRRFRNYAFELTSDDERYVDYLDTLFDAFDPCGPNGSSVRSIAVLTRGNDRDVGGEDGEDVTIDGELYIREQVRGRAASTVVHAITRQMIEASEALGLHAGGVVRHGIGVALPAHMESGKSTLTAGLVRSGFDYLSDEAVLLDWETHRVIPFPKPISLDPGSWHLFPELEPQAPLPPGYKDAQWHVPASAIRPDSVAGPCRIRYFVFPRYAAGATTRLTPLRRAEATIELAKNTFRFNERPRHSLDALAAEVGDAECFQLDIGDLETAVALVSELVEHGR